MRILKNAILACVALCWIACDPGPKSSMGFRLPDGDIEKGKATFIELRCHLCHTVAGVELPPGEPLLPVMIELGGQVREVKTYGELVTSIINPSHRFAKGYKKELIEVDGKSRMTDYTEVMTVRQMVNLVAFLQSRYEIILPLMK
ncbi:MAG: cytochrome C [Terriglobia bacterium]